MCRRPFLLIPIQIYLVAYLRRGLESRNEQCFQFCFLFEKLQEITSNQPLFISVEVEGMQLIVVQ